MPESKKAKVAKPKSPSKPKVAIAKPATKLITGFVSKPKAKVTAKPVAKSAAKPVPKAPEVKAPVAKKARAYSRKSKGSFADLLKIQFQYEEAKKGAKTDLKKQFDAHLREADKVKAQYKELFGESIESASKARGAGAKKTSSKGYSIEQVKLFIDQTENGEKIKIPGKNATGIARIKAAYEKAKDKDAESVHELLK